MLVSKFARFTVPLLVGRNVFVLKQQCPQNITSLRQYAREFVKTGGLKRKTLRETLAGPATETPYAVGKIGIAVGAGLGVGALCFYGLGLSNQAGAIDRAAFWPEYVRSRVHTTYLYFGGGLVLTALATIGVARTPVLMNIAMRQGWLAIIGTIAAMIATGAVCRSIPYDSNSMGMKHLAWGAHVAVMGGVIAPLMLLGGPLLIRAALYTAGIVSGLSAVAACAPHDKFLNWGGPLAIGLGVVFVSSLGTMFLPPTTALGAGLYSIAMYGGLALFSLFLLYDTQRIVKQAESYPQYAARPFDPINASIGIYLDTLNIFIRMAMILSGGGSRRR